MYDQSIDLTLLPPNSTKLEKGFAKLTQKISCIDVPYTQLKSIPDCPVQFLPWLAWEKRVDFWDPTWSETQKRAVLTDSPTFNQQRGTRSSIQYVLDQFQLGWNIQAWHELTPLGEPYTFVLSNPAAPSISLDDLQDLNTRVDATKSARDAYVVASTVLAEGTVYVMGTLHSFEQISISTQG